MTLLTFWCTPKCNNSWGVGAFDPKIEITTFFIIKCLIVNLIIVEVVWTKLIKVNLVLNVYSNVVVCKTVYIQFGTFVSSNCHNLYPIWLLIEQSVVTVSRYTTHAPTELKIKASAFALWSTLVQPKKQLSSMSILVHNIHSSRMGCWNCWRHVMRNKTSDLKLSLWRQHEWLFLFFWCTTKWSWSWGIGCYWFKDCNYFISFNYPISDSQLDHFRGCLDQTHKR